VVRASPREGHILARVFLVKAIHLPKFSASSNITLARRRGRASYEPRDQHLVFWLTCLIREYLTRRPPYLSARSRVPAASWHSFLFREPSAAQSCSVQQAPFENGQAGAFPFPCVLGLPRVMTRGLPGNESAYPSSTAFHSQYVYLPLYYVQRHQHHNGELHKQVPHLHHRIAQFRTTFRRSTMSISLSGSQGGYTCVP